MEPTPPDAVVSMGAAAAETDCADLCAICHESMDGSSSQHRQPMCGHKLHEKCWQHWVFISTSDPLRCLTCQRPIDQMAVSHLIKKLLVLFGQNAMEECQELLQQLVVLGESELLFQEGEQGGSEAAYPSTLVILFANYMSSIVREAQASPDSFDWEVAVQRLCLFEKHTHPSVDPGIGLRLFGALMWDMEPEKTAKLPAVAKVLELDKGNTDAYLLLMALCSHPELPFWDFRKAMAAYRKAVAEGCSLLYCRGIWVDGFMKGVAELLRRKALDECREHLPLFLALGESQELLEEPEQDALRRVHTNPTETVLLTYYVSGLLQQAQASPDCFEWERAADRLEWLIRDRTPEELVTLAAVAWDMEPEQTAKLPLVARVLKLRQGEVETLKILFPLHAAEEGPFSDFSKALALLRQAQVQGVAEELLALCSPDVLRKVCLSLLGSVPSPSPQAPELSQPSGPQHGSQDAAAVPLAHQGSEQVPGHEAAELLPPQLVVEQEPEEAHQHEAVELVPPPLPAQLALLPEPEEQQELNVIEEQLAALRPSRHLALLDEHLDDRDLDLQIALDESLEESADPLLAVRRNPKLMHRQVALLPDDEEQVVHEELILLQFKRSSVESRQRLHHGELLRPCREALEEAGCLWLLERGAVKVFVHPCQYDLTLQLLEQHAGGLFPRHVVTTESFLPLVLQALEGCTAGAGKLKTQVKLGEVPMAAESEEPETETVLSSLGQMPPGETATTGTEPMAEGLFLLQFQRSSAEFQQRLQLDERLQPCRQALEAAGCRWFLKEEVNRVKVFVHPTQYYLAVQLLRKHKPRGLHERHVLVSESFLQLVLDTLKGCSGGGGILKKTDGRVQIGDVSLGQNSRTEAAGSSGLRACLEVAGMETRGAGLNTQRFYHHRPVPKSTGTASNPRRRKPNYLAMSLSSSSQVSGHNVDSHGGEELPAHATATEPESLNCSEDRSRGADGPGQFLAAPPGLAPMLEALGLSKQRTFFDSSPRRSRKRVAASTRTCQSNPRCRVSGSEAGEIEVDI